MLVIAQGILDVSQSAVAVKSRLSWRGLICGTGVNHTAGTLIHVLNVPLDLGIRLPSSYRLVLPQLTLLFHDRVVDPVLRVPLPLLGLIKQSQLIILD